MMPSQTQTMRVSFPLLYYPALEFYGSGKCTNQNGGQLVLPSPSPFPSVCATTRHTTALHACDLTQSAPETASLRCSAFRAPSVALHITVHWSQLQTSLSQARKTGTRSQDCASEEALGGTMIMRAEAPREAWLIRSTTTSTHIGKTNSERHIRSYLPCVASQAWK